MTSSESIDATINLGLTGQQNVQSAVNILRNLQTAFSQASGGASLLVAKDKELAESQSATLKVYQQTLSILQKYNQAATQQSATLEQQEAAAKGLQAALTGLAGAAERVAATSKEDAAAQTNTLGIYRQLIGLSQQSAQITQTEATTKLTLARAETELARTKAQTAIASQQEIAAQRLANGQGAPLTDQQAALLSLRNAQQQEAAAAKATAQAEAEQAASARQAAVAARELAAAATSAAAAYRAQQVPLQAAAAAARSAQQAKYGLAAADQQAAAAARTDADAQTSASAANSKVANSAGSAQFALYQVAYAYKALSTATLEFATSPISVATSYQAAFAQVVRTTNVGTQSIEQTKQAASELRGELVALSDAVPVSFQDLAAVATVGNQLGIEASNIETFTENVAKFSALTGISGQSTATFLGRISNLLGTLPSQYEAVTSTILDLGNKTAATESEILALTQNIAGSAANAGFAQQDVYGLAAALASLKVPPEMARGTLTRVLGSIKSAALEGGPALQKYATILGLTNEKAQALFKSSPGAFFQDLVKSLSAVNDAGGDVNAVLASIGIKQVRDINVLQRLAGNYQLLSSSIRESYKEFELGNSENNALTKQSTIVFATLASQIQTTKNSYNNFLDSVGSDKLGILNGLTSIVQKFFTALTDAPTGVKNAVFTFALIVGGVAAVRGAIALTMAAIVAFRQVVGTNIGALGVSFRGLQAVMNNTYAQGTQAAQAGAAGVAGANGAITGSSDAATAALAAEAAAMAAQTRAAQLNALASANVVLSSRLVATGAAGAAAGIIRNTAALTVNTTEEELNATAKRLSVLATALQAGSIGGVDVALNQETAALVRNTATLYENAAAARTAGAAQATAGAGARAGAAGAAAASATRAGSGAAGGIAGFFGGTAGLLATGGIIAAVSLLPTLISLFTRSGDAAEAAAAKQKALGDAYIASVGGIDSLNQAITADTKAFQDAGNVVNDTNQVYMQYKTTVNDLHDGTAQVSKAWYDSAGNAHDLTTQVYQYADSVKTADREVTTIKASTDGYNTGVGLNTDQLEENTVAIGKNVLALNAKALIIKTLGDGTDANKGVITQSDVDDFNVFGSKLVGEAKKTGGSISLALNEGMKNGVAAFDKATEPYLNSLRTRIKSLMDAKSGILATQTGNQALSPEQDKQVKQLEAQSNALKDVIAKYGQLHDVVAGQVQGQSLATSSQELFTQILKDAGVKLDDLTGDTSTLDDGLGNLGDTVTATGNKVVDMGQKFSDSVKTAFDFVDAASAMADAETKLGQAIANNGPDFSAQSEAGRQNLAALEATVNAESGLLAKQIQNGQITAEQAAVQLQQYMTGLTNQLASQGVDTSQLKFLTDYVAGIVANPAVWSIGVDTSSANAGIANVVNNANIAKAAVSSIGPASVTFDQDYRNSSDAASTAAAQQLSVPNAVAPTATSQQIIQQAQDAQTLNNEWAKATALAQEQTQAASQAGSAARSAGKDATKASNDAANAEQHASDVAQKHAEYLKAVADFYGKIGTTAFASVADQNKVVQSVAALGTALAENGRTFSTTTNEGQANLAALSSAFDAYGSTLSESITDGTLSIGQAQQQLNQFGAGLRNDLAAAGVPAGQLNTIFKQLGISGSQSFSKANGQAQAYTNVLGDADRAATAALNEGRINRAAQATKQLVQYTKDLSSYYAGLATNLFASINAEGDVFASIQKLGASLQANGNGFNNVTQGGRDNLDALKSTLDAEGKLLSQSVASGKESSSDAAKDFAAFAGGIYNELVKTGVKANDIKAIFSGLGIDPKGFTGANAAVAQYAGTLTNAEKAAVAAAAATDKVAVATGKAADYAARLKTQFDDSFSSFFDLTDAADATASAILGIRDSYQGALDTVKQLREENRNLSDDMASQRVIAANAQRDYGLALKYGQAAEAADFKAQRDAANTKVNEDQTKIGDNNNTIATTQAGVGNLKGNTKEAIENRKSLQDLQATMLDQIAAYVKTGASTKQVTQYTADLKKQFDATAKQAGYSTKDIQGYNKQFDAYAQIIKSVPKNVTTSVNVVGANAATAALNALPKSGTYKTTATADTKNATNAISQIPKSGGYTLTTRIDTKYGLTNIRNDIAKIPKVGAYTVKAQLAGGSAGAAGAITGGVPKTGSYTVTPQLSAIGLAALRRTVETGLQPAQVAISGILKVFGISVGGGGIATPDLHTNRYTVDGIFNSAGKQIGFEKGGLVPKSVRGFATGGLVPGTPPSGPGDNLLARGPGGMLTIRSGEYVQTEKAVNFYGLPFMDAIRSLKFPRLPQFYAGGSVSSGGGSSSSDFSGPSVVQLSRADRALLQQIRDTQGGSVNLDGSRVGSVTRTRNAVAYRSGTTS